MASILIPDMHCDGCARGVLAALREAAPGAEVSVDLATRLVRVSGGPPAGVLVAALRGEGWDAREG